MEREEKKKGIVDKKRITMWKRKKEKKHEGDEYKRKREGKEVKKKMEERE